LATLWIMIGAITAAIIARGVKVSEFRQAWINELRSDITMYATKAHEWIELYEKFNSDENMNEKAKLAPTLDRLKYDALHNLNRIKLRFKPDDVDGNRLLEKLSDLLDPGKLAPPSQYSSWRILSDEAISETRKLLKEEWEATKDPLRRVPAWQRWGVIVPSVLIALAAITNVLVDFSETVERVIHARSFGAVPASAAVHMGTDEKGSVAVCVSGSAYDIPASGDTTLKARLQPARPDEALAPDLHCQN
jgi:hypothetical protein